MSTITKEGFGRLVWAPHSTDGYVIGRLKDIGCDSMVVELLDGSTCIAALYSDVFPADEDRFKEVEDNCALMYLNEGTLLNNCRLRYSKLQIYTYVANILISINPYEQIPDLYNSTTIQKYFGKSLGTLPPHIFAIADFAYRDMKRLGKSQSIIVSGESGAGKTESQKQVLKYLCKLWGSSGGSVEQRILESNPILEAFGNAKTLRNNNSSRFGKFIEIHFSSKNSVAGGFVSHYLLEKSRICHQEEGERNYHIFYQLIAGATDEEAAKLCLNSPDNFIYLKRGCIQFFSSSSSASRIPLNRYDSRKNNLNDELLDDYKDFQRLRNGLKSLGWSEEEFFKIFEIVAAVLHLGNITFTDQVEDKGGGCAMCPEANNSLTIASRLLGLSANDLRVGLISRVMQPTRGGTKGTMIKVPLKTYDAAAARDALAKSIYSRLFDSIVHAINKAIPFEDSCSYIGVLDIAGFEFFTVNSFEQFCINYCNEKLQNFFNERILKQEQVLYKKEGLNVPHIDYNDNEDCIDLFECKVNGLLDMLDEEARLPQASAKHFTSSVHQKMGTHFRLSVPRKSKLREHRHMRDEDGFIIRHYAGSVCYQTALFIEKNNDALHTSLEILMEESSNPWICRLFTTREGKQFSDSVHSRGKANKLALASVSSKFRTQLNLLLDKLNLTDTHFIRCIKPNSEMKLGKFEGAQILSQLKCAGMTSVLKLMQKGYPSRTMFADLYNTYQKILPAQLSRLDNRIFCKCLFHALGLNDEDYKFGQTKVFFKPGKFAEFDQMLRQDKEHMEQLVSKIKCWLYRIRWKKAQYGVWSCIKLKNKIVYRSNAYKKMQSGIRGYLVRKVQRPRLLIYHQLVVELSRLDKFGCIIEKLPATSQQKFSTSISELRRKINELILDMKFSTKTHAEHRGKLTVYMNEVETLLLNINNELTKKEQEAIRLKQIEKEIEKERADKRISMLEKDKHEQQRAVRFLIEEARKVEENKFLSKQSLMENQKIIEQTIEQARQKQLEQERLDAELMKRLAQENDRLHVIESTFEPLKSSDRYNLSSWKYADLRDAINTSTDIDLLNECRNEFHRRMLIYRQWQEANRNNNEQRNELKIPMGLMPTTSTLKCLSKETPQHENIQRFFKVPFRNSGGTTFDASLAPGMWYGHFDGQWIGRQIEIHPDKPALLLVAGKDDEHMCELPLQHTQLTRKKGAEILPEEFEILWLRLGGEPYTGTGKFHTHQKK